MSVRGAEAAEPSSAGKRRGLPVQHAMKEHQFKGNYFCVYPIKVNQQRQVVEEVLNFGRPFHFGLEAGSKPELLAVVALASNDTPIIWPVLVTLWSPRPRRESAPSWPT